MPASISDFTDLATTGKTPAQQWPQLVRILQDFMAFWNNSSRAGTFPNNRIQNLELGDAVAQREWRIHFD